MTEKHFTGATDASPLLRNAPSGPQRHKTVLVIGQPRGGTSMVAAILDALGVYMGDPAELRNGGSFESFVFCHGKDEQRVAEIDRLNGLHEIWGWKQPYGTYVLELLPKNVRNPYCLFIIRDVVAIAQAYMKHANVDMPASWQYARRENARLLDHAFGTAHPSLIASYERVKLAPEPYISSLSSFLGINPGPDAIKEALSRVNPGGGYVSMPNDYGWPPAPAPHTTPEKWGR